MRLACVGFACMLVGHVVPAAADNDADRLFAEGKRLLAKKDYARACAAFEQSFEADAAIGTQLNIALCYEKWGHWRQAYQAYTEAARLAREAGDKRMSEIRKLLERAGRKISRLVVRIPDDADPRLVFTVDDELVDRAALAEGLVLEPGVHTIVARVPGGTKVSEQVDLVAGARDHVELDLPVDKGASSAAAAPPPAPRSRPPVPAPKATAVAADVAIVDAPHRKRGRLIGGAVLAGSGVAAIGIGSYIALDARADYQEAAKQCPSGMCESPEAFAATSDARDRARTMTYVFVGGAALVAIGTYLLATSGGARAKDSRVSASLVITPDDVGFVIGGRL